MIAVHDYASGEHLDGVPSARLVAASVATAVGAEHAYVEGGTWHWVGAADVETLRRRGVEVRTVYVEGPADGNA